MDTHAATHSLALVSAATGGVVDQAVFPNSPLGARPCVGLAHGVGLLVAEPAAMAAGQKRGVGKAGAAKGLKTSHGAHFAGESAKTSCRAISNSGASRSCDSFVSRVKAAPNRGDSVIATLPGCYA